MAASTVVGRIYTHTSVQCSPASVGLAQARPNYSCGKGHQALTHFTSWVELGTRLTTNQFVFSGFSVCCCICYQKITCRCFNFRLDDDWSIQLKCWQVISELKLVTDNLLFNLSIFFPCIFNFCYCVCTMYVPWKLKQQLRGPARSAT